MRYLTTALTREEEGVLLGKSMKEILDAYSGDVLKLATLIAMDAGRIDLRDDVYQECMIGLMKAVSRLKAGNMSLDETCKFCTYASYWCYRESERFIRKNRLPFNPKSISVKDIEIEVTDETCLANKPSGEDIAHKVEVKLALEEIEHKVQALGNETLSNILFLMKRGYTITEAAREIGIKPNTAVQSLKRFREKLRS